MSKPGKHINSLDWVRGLAAFIVVVFHLAGGAKSSNPAVHFFGAINKAGWTGVTLFFVLSGFLITGILWDTRDDPHKFKNFYARRALRIFPLYYVTLIIVAVGAVAASTWRQCLSSIWVFALYLQNIWIFAPKVGHIGSPFQLSHFWSLAVEEQFYLIWPFLVYRSRSLAQAKRLCLFAIAASLAFRLALIFLVQDPGAFADSSAARGGELAAGAFLAISYRDGSWKKLKRAAPAVFLFSLLVFAAVFPVAPFQGSIPAGMFLWSSFLVMALTEHSIVKSIMETRWLRWVGTISYGVYVYHVLFLSQYGWMADHLLRHSTQYKRLVLKAALDVSGTLLLGSASFYLFERPILSLRKRFRPVTVAAGN